MEKKKQILADLQNKINFLIEEEGFNEERILGIFLYGSQNYNLDTAYSDIDALVIVLPSFSDFCLGEQTVSMEILMSDNTHVLVKDITSFRNEILKQNLCRIEILFTEYFILNPRYAALFYQYFQKERNNIAYINKERGIKAVYHQAKHELKEYYRIKAPKKLRNISRLAYYLSFYVNDENLDKAIKLENNEYRDLLMRLTRGELSEEECFSITDKLEKYLDTFEGGYAPSERSKAGVAALNNGVIEILKLSFTELSSYCSKEDFFQHLTNAEERAYKTIISEIKDEGNITISRLVEKHGISRPVYNNLLIKMKEDNVATVVNMGMKGTYIKITHPELRAEVR